MNEEQIQIPDQQRTYDDKHKAAMEWLMHESTQLINARLAKHLLDYIYKLEELNERLESSQEPYRGGAKGSVRKPRGEYIGIRYFDAP